MHCAAHVRRGAVRSAETPHRITRPFRVLDPSCWSQEGECVDDLNHHLPSFFLEISRDEDCNVSLKRPPQKILPYTFVREEGSFHFPSKLWALWRTRLRIDLSSFSCSFCTHHRDSWERLSLHQFFLPLTRGAKEHCKVRCSLSLSGFLCKGTATTGHGQGNPEPQLPGQELLLQL